MAAFKMVGCISVTISQLLLNPERWYFRFYGSIDATDSAKLPCGFLFYKSKIATYNMTASIMASFCYLYVHAPLCARSYIRPLYWKATEIILDSQLGSHFESIILVVCGFQTFLNLLLYAIGTLMDGTWQNWNFRDRLWWKYRNPCYDWQIKHFLASFLYRQSLKHVMVYEDDRWYHILEVAAMGEEGCILC